jgi:hypothetical protein
VGFYAGRDERESEKYQEALARRTALKNKIDQDQQEPPRVELVFAVDVESYLARYREQEGDSETLTTQLKQDMFRALSAVQFDLLAQEIVLHQEASNFGIHVPIRDSYAAVEETSEEITECEG